LTQLSLKPGSLGLGVLTPSRGDVGHASKLIVPLIFLVYKRKEVSQFWG